MKIRNIAGLILMSCICTIFTDAQNSRFDLATPHLTSFPEIPFDVFDPDYPWVNPLDSSVVFDPNLWKITFPVEDPKTGNALEVLNPDFSSYVLGTMEWPEELARYFYTTGEGQAFYCEYTGATTANSEYGRTELREMVGPDQHNWTLQTGGHMHGRVRISDLKGDANKLIFMQIHGKAPSDKVLLKCIWEKGTIRLLTKSGIDLIDYKKGDNGKYTVVGEEWFTCTVDVDSAEMSVKINGETVETFDREEVLQYWPAGNTYYFKAGNYLQHKTEGAAATVTCSGLEVSHESNPVDTTDTGHFIYRFNDDNLRINTYPNPFSSETTIRYNLKTAARGSLSIYNGNGTRIKSFFENKMVYPGTHSIAWDGTNDAGVPVAPGTYFYIFHGVDGACVFSHGDKIVFIR